MKAVVIYDSLYGNTEKIARAIGEAIKGDVKVVSVSQANTTEFKSVNLLIVGSPTQGGNATKDMQAFLNSIPDASLKGVQAAAFDTRMTSAWVKIFGFAAGRIAKKLSSKGASLIGSPEGFFVTGTKGPLKNGEIERAAGWVKEISKG